MPSSAIPQNVDPRPVDPRMLAARQVLAVLSEGRMLADLPPSAADPATRARAHHLARATLRELRRADAVLAPLLRKPPAELVMALLRVAVVEHHRLGTPAHAVVNSVVQLLKQSPRTAPAAGMANAVLRRAAAADWSALAVPTLPGWLRRRLSRAYTPAVVAAFEQAHLAGAPLDLTLAPLPEAERLDLMHALEARALPGGSLRRLAGVQVSALAGFGQGRWWVQDAAAALPALLLDARAEEHVLDLCAAPGGKTLQLAARGARVTALDLSAGRLERLHQNLARTGLSAEVVVADALEWRPSAPVDAILLDAPCSATGTIRRHPDLPYLRKPADVEALVTLQARLLDRAIEFLRPGGRLVYCTCSLLPDEGEAQVTAALARHPGLRVQPAALPFGHATAEGGWRTRPDDLASEGGVDGFYMALLHRA